MPRAFIIDSHPETANTLKSYLESEGIDASAFDNVDDAFAAFASGSPCVIIIDLNVPGAMSAHSFIQQTKQSYPDLPIILISSDPRAKTTAESINAYFLLRPFTLREIVAKVRETCTAQ